MTAATDAKDLVMICLESLQHHLTEKKSLDIQLSESKLIIQVAVKKLSATEDYDLNSACLLLIRHLLIEKRLVTFTLSESKIYCPVIRKAALKQLSGSSDVVNACLALLEYLLLDEIAVIFTFTEIDLIGKAALKQLSDTNVNASAKACLALIQYMKNGENTRTLLPSVRVIKVVVSCLQTLLHSDNQSNNDQVLRTITVMAWDIIAQELDFDLNGGKVWQHLLTFTETEGVQLIKDQLQKFPGKENSITRVVKSLSELASAWPNSMHDPIISTLMWILNATTEADFPVRYWSACALCHLINFFQPASWSERQPSHTQVMDAVAEAIAGWSLTDEPLQEYTSFGKVGEPLYRLAQGPPEIQPCCLHKDVWILANVTTHSSEHYCYLLEKHHKYHPKGVIKSGTGVEVLQAVTESSSYSDAIKILAKTTLQQYEDYNRTK